MLLISVATALLNCPVSLTAKPAVAEPGPAAPVLAKPVSAKPAAATPAPARPAPTQQGVDATIKRAVAAWSRVKTFRASFEQTLVNPITGSSMVARGELQQRKPNQLAIKFVDPAGDQIVGDGKFVWVYLQSATPGQVIKLATTDAGAASSDLIGQFLTTPRSKYDATDGGADKVGDRAARVVVLVAKPREVLPFVRAKVWVDATDGLIRQFEATDANGVSRKVRLTTVKPNADVDAGAFTFKVPDGVRVVER